MSRMGGTCSMQSHRSRWESDHTGMREGEHGSSGLEHPTGRRSSRHSVIKAIPDFSISNFYPTSDNYVTEDNGLRSPKCLADLSVDSLCRSLSYLDGELPPGLPQNVVDDVVGSLVKHSALNATTLKVLRHCELGSLSLAGCRGVTDKWLEPLSSQSIASSPQHSYLTPETGEMEHMDLDECDRKPAPFYSVAYDPHLDTYPDSRSTSFQEQVEDSSSSSTSSFISASPTPHLPVTHDHAMADHASKEHQVPVTSDMVACMVDRDPMFAGSRFPANPVTANMTLLDLRGSQRLTDKGLIQLSDLTSLEVARLDNCHSIVGRGLLALSASHRIHTLSLANCRRLTDEAIINISHLTSLEALSLDGCRCLTDRSLAAISGLYRLRKLDLSQCDLLTDSGIEEFEDLEVIEELSLGWCRSITDHGLDILTNQGGRREFLKLLRLARCPITDNGVVHLGRLSSLEELDLNGCSNIGSSALGKTLALLPKLANLDVSYCPGILRTSWQGGIKALKSLELCYSGVRDSHLTRLTHLPALEELNLDSCLVGDRAISHLADDNVVPNLKSLDLADTDLTDLGMVHIAKFKNLTRLSLFYCNITNGGLRHLANLTQLEALNLDSREIGDDGLWHLRHLEKLKSLDIFSGRITDSGCSHIAKIKSLDSLELCGGGIGDLGCTLLATLENLTSLNLSQNERITNRGAAALAALTNLKTLNLSNTRVNSHALVYFTGLLKLQSLALYGCSGIDDNNGLDQLQNGLPNLKCLRMNTVSPDDGVMMRIDDDSDDGDDLDSDSDMVFTSRRPLVPAFQNSDSSSDDDDSDDDDDSEMDDEDDASAGDDSYSDHE